MRITPEIAHSIILKLKKLVTYNINIMNDKGVIVGSSDPSRLQQVHQGALMVLDTKKAIFIYSEDEVYFQGAKPGVNLPIEIHKNITGCIGVTGNPKDVIQFAEILKVTVEVMLQEMELFNKLQYENKIMENWVLDFVHPSSTDLTKLEADGVHYLNLDFKKEITIILIQFVDILTVNNRDMEEVLRIRKQKDEHIHQIRALMTETSFSAFLDDECCLIAVPHKEDRVRTIANTIKAYFLQQKIEVRIGMGDSYRGLMGFRKSYFEARDSLALLARFPKPEKMAHISEWGILHLFQQVPLEALKSFYAQYLPDKVKLNQEQVHTLESLYDNGLNMKATAESLHIHRNTLLYRLDSISKRTGLDPKFFHDALMLRLLMVIEKLIL